MLDKQPTTARPPSLLLLLGLAMALGLALAVPPALAAGASQTASLSDETISLTVTYDAVLVTNERYIFAIEVDWNGSTESYELLITLEGNSYTKSLDPSASSYAQVISQNSFDKDALNSPVVFTLKLAGGEVDTAQGVVDINFQQANDLTFLYLGYTFIWAGVFAYLFYLHRQQESLTKLVQSLKSHKEDNSVGPEDEQ